jgi:hypothetical protein
MAGSADFFAPFAQVEIRNKAGKEWVFDVGRWPTGNAPSSDAVMGGPFVTSVSVTQDLEGTHEGLTIGIEAPYQEGIYLLEQGAFDMLNEVRARMGYLAGTATEVTADYGGFLGKGGDGLALSSDKLSGSLTANYQDARQAAYVKADDGMFGDSAKQILEEAARAIGYTMVPLGDGAAKLEEMSKQMKAGGKDLESVAYGVAGTTAHMVTIRRILSMANLDFHFGNAIATVSTFKPAVFYYPKGYAATQTPMYALVLRGLFDPSSDPPQYPILDVSFSGGAAMWAEGRKWDAVPVPGATAGVRAVVIEKDTGIVLDPLWVWPKDMERPADPKGSAVASEAQDDKRGEVQADAKIDPGGKKGVPAKRAVAAPSGAEKAKAQAELAAQGVGAADRMAIVLTVTTLGLPSVQPGMPVTVAGCSSMMNSTYQVRKVTHNYAPGDWKTVLELVKWGSTQTSNLAQTQTQAQPMKEA